MIMVNIASSFDKIETSLDPAQVPVRQAYLLLNIL